jgi:serine/threonine protein kinase
VRRLRREAELAARLAHRNVVAVLDAGSRPREYLVMELVDGPTLATFPTVSVDALLQVCDALEHAHGRGVVHGDVGPCNIVIGRRDGTAKLIDFGHAVEGFGIDPDLDALGALASNLPGDPERPVSIAELRESLLAMRSVRSRAA